MSFLLEKELNLVSDFDLNNKRCMEGDGHDGANESPCWLAI